MTDEVTSEPEFLIQTRVEPPGGAHLQEAGDFAIVASEKKLADAAALAEKTGKELHGAFERLAPTRGSVAFSITFTGEAGIPMIAKGTGSGTLTITLEWTKEDTK